MRDALLVHRATADGVRSNVLPVPGHVRPPLLGRRPATAGERAIRCARLTEDLVPGPSVGDAGTGLGDLAGEIAAADRGCRAAQTELQPPSGDHVAPAAGRPASART